MEEIHSLPSLIGTILTTLTNLALNDQNNVQIRLNGAHLIGRILMENCPALSKSDPANQIEYSSDPSTNIKI